MTYAFDPDWCMAPGVILREMLDNAGLSGHLGIIVVAKLAGLPAATIEGILDASVEITPDIAARLGSGSFWLNAERIYRDALKAGKTDVSADYAPERTEP